MGSGRSEFGKQKLRQGGRRLRLRRGSIGGQGPEQQEAVAGRLDRQTEAASVPQCGRQSLARCLQNVAAGLEWGEVMTSPVSPTCPSLCPPLSLQAAGGSPVGWEWSRGHLQVRRGTPKLFLCQGQPRYRGGVAVTGEAWGPHGAHPASVPVSSRGRSSVAPQQRWTPRDDAGGI